MTLLKDFVVINKLTIDQIRVKPRQVSARYLVELPGGSSSSTRLIYSFSNSIFSSRDHSDRNLASMMLAQVALNYGLFCKEIVFEGSFDEADRSFLKAMMENTSREILTNKLLVDNSFLVPPFDKLKIEKRQNYTQAKIEFQSDNLNITKSKSPHNEPDRSKYAILSSGGKDSLLSYGMIREFGEAHPIFVNEAGRHWFTAINAYRHYRSKEPNTQKVWCNSDRVFNFMLRNLKFIRPDFSRVRSDMYPIRLYTVAVFLFGVLPIAIKRGLKNVVIGDEYDTTDRKTTQGISHYNALYDQSKYFDNAMTRYYRRKGWNLFQFSMLRSMSELLIMKVLIDRYPEIQKTQVSCHAAHSHKSKMVPCGNCEKCRRIIGMIRALGGDPENCGYSKAQIEKALKALSAVKVKQIGTDAAHLYYLLLKNELIQKNDFTSKLAKEHQEVMKLRFDKERSDLGDLPEYVRKPTLSILKEYSEGEVEWISGKWKAIKLDNKTISSKKYIYDE